jgi:Helix-turn-helix domain
MSELLTVAEVAEILGVGEDTVTRRFAKVKGVIDLGTPETPRRRRYRVLRIPKSVVEKYLLARGGPVEVKTPTRPPKASKRVLKVPPNEDEIVRQLATIAKQHGAEAQKTLDRIAERARLLKFVPEDKWSEVVWLDEEDDEI